MNFKVWDSINKELGVRIPQLLMLHIIIFMSNFSSFNDRKAHTFTFFDLVKLFFDNSAVLINLDPDGFLQFCKSNN